MNKIKLIKRVSILAFLISLFCTIDLGLNFLYNTETHLHDGSFKTCSILQILFNIFGDSNWTFERFFYAFEISVWLTFIFLMLNIILIHTKQGSSNSY